MESLHHNSPENNMFYDKQLPLTAGEMTPDILEEIEKVRVNMANRIEEYKGILSGIEREVVELRQAVKAASQKIHVILGYLSIGNIKGTDVTEATNNIKEIKQYINDYTFNANDLVKRYGDYIDITSKLIIDFNTLTKKYEAAVRFDPQNN